MGLLIKLKNGDTELKSLKYGNDRPGGGDSGQPYVKDSIDQPTSTSDRDSILRGGLKAPSTAAEDVSRLTKYFFDFRNPNGLLFVGKQNLLSRISPKTETSFGPAYGGVSKNINIQNENFSIIGNQISGDTSYQPDNGTLNAGIYSPLSTLAQVGVGFIGTHLNKQGLDPSGKNTDLSIRKYQDVAYENNLEKNNNVTGIVDLSLVKKERELNQRIINQNEKIQKYQNTLNTNPERKDFFTTKNSISLFQTAGTLLTPFRTLASTLNTGLSGESSITTGDELGVRTALYLEDKRNEILNRWDKYVDILAEKRKIKTENAQDRAIDGSIKVSNQIQAEENKVRYSNRLLQLWNSSGLNRDNKFLLASDVLYSYSGGPNSALGVGNTEIKFATKNDGKTASRTNEFQYTDKKDFTLSVPGYSIETQFNVPQSKPYKTSDSVTLTPIYSSDVPVNSEIDTAYRDLIPFYIGILEYKVKSKDNNIAPPNKTYLHFRAYIDNFGDSYKAKWKSINYMGRPEAFFKYQSFDRDMSIGFTVVAHSRAEQNAMYEKLNYLASTLAPEYTKYGYMSGNISYLTVGDYVSEQPGIIESLDFEIPEESPWETARDQDGNLVDPSDVRRLPFMIKVKMKFQPIHTFRPERQKDPSSQLYIDQSKPKLSTPTENGSETPFGANDNTIIGETNNLPTENNSSTEIFGLNSGNSVFNSF